MNNTMSAAVAETAQAALIVRSVSRPIQIGRAHV